MSKLSDEKILELAHRRATKYTHWTTPGEAAYGFTAQHLIDFVRHDIEAAVLEAQKQEPVAWAYTINNSHSVFSAEKPPEDAYDEGTLYPLYAAPVVQPDMVLVPREPTEAMEGSVLNCAIYNIEYEEDVYLKNFAECYKFMLIAAAEGKSNDQHNRPASAGQG